MEISIFRNGEMWKAQVIIPKTNMNTVDLPPSNHRVNKNFILIESKYIRSINHQKISHS